MATISAIAQELKRMLAAYPQHTARLSSEQIIDMAEVWQSDLADLPDALLGAACRNHREHSQWLPSIAEIRASAVSLMRQASPAHQTAGEAWGEVKRAVRTYGSYGVTVIDEASGQVRQEAPAFANPVTAAVIRRMGWKEFCMSEDPEAVNRAQFERFYNSEIERLEATAAQSPAVAAFVQSMTAGQQALPEPGQPVRSSTGQPVGAIIHQIAEARRL